MDISELYQEVIIDHNRNPQNFGALENPDRMLEGFNPLCGDRLTLYMNTTGEQVSHITFNGSGCAISVASASLMTHAIQGKTFTESENLFHLFHNLITTDQDYDINALGKLAVFAGVRTYPSRIKCASLCWHTLHALLQGDQAPVSTE